MYKCGFIHLESTFEIIKENVRKKYGIIWKWIKRGWWNALGRCFFCSFRSFSVLSHLPRNGRISHSNMYTLYIHFSSFSYYFFPCTILCHSFLRKSACYWNYTTDILWKSQTSFRFVQCLLMTYSYNSKESVQSQNKKKIKIWNQLWRAKYVKNRNNFAIEWQHSREKKKL